MISHVSTSNDQIPRFLVASKVVYFFMERGSTWCKITPSTTHGATVFKSYVTAPLVISNMATAGPTVWYQTVLNVKPKSRGVHVITDEIEKIPELKKYKVGLAHLLLQHTSASICVNECWDSSVRHDMEMMLNRLAPEQGPPYKHTIEGPDDMPG